MIIATREKLNDPKQPPHYSATAADRFHVTEITDPATGELFWVTIQPEIDSTEELSFTLSPNETSELFHLLGEVLLAHRQKQEAAATAPETQEWPTTPSNTCSPTSAPSPGETSPTSPCTDATTDA